MLRALATRLRKRHGPSIDSPDGVSYNLLSSLRILNGCGALPKPCCCTTRLPGLVLSWRSTIVYCPRPRRSAQDATILVVPTGTTAHRSAAVRNDSMAHSIANVCSICHLSVFPIRIGYVITKLRVEPHSCCRSQPDSQSNQSFDTALVFIDVASIKR